MGNKLDKVRAIVPNFDDPKAVIREYSDEKGELQKIEIFYGGETGGDSKGHGHWAAEKINDLFQVTLDRSPDNVDGGRYIIEKISKHDAYNEETRKDRISAKESIINNKQEQLSNLLSRLEPGYNNPHRYEIAARRNEKESQLKSAIADMEMKKSSIISEIADLQSKLDNSY